MLPNNLIMSIKYLYEPSHLTLHDYMMQKESQEYAAASFKLNNHTIVFRQAKITPTKTGQFVTIWKRNNSGPIMPFDANDSIDFFIIGITQNGRMGQFIFPKQLLQQHGCISVNGVGGKRAIRVYPPWAHNLNAQARKTQSWQASYFFEINQHDRAVTERLAAMFHL